MNKPIDPRPCPHCGGPVDIHQNYSYKNKCYFVYVRCCVCGAQSRTFGCKDDASEHDWNNKACRDAIKAWNLRV